MLFRAKKKHIYHVWRIFFYCNTTPHKAFRLYYRVPRKTHNLPPKNNKMSTRQKIFLVKNLSKAKLPSANTISTMIHSNIIKNHKLSTCFFIYRTSASNVILTVEAWRDFKTLLFAYNLKINECFLKATNLSASKSLISEGIPSKSFKVGRPLWVPS